MQVFAPTFRLLTVNLVFNVQCSKFNVYFKVLKKVNYSFKLINAER